MASDRWRSDDDAPKTSPAVEKKSSGVDPSLFYKKKKLLSNNHHQSAAEKQLGDLLQLASHNETVQKRHEYTTVQKIKRDAYHSVTSLTVFPLQDMAMENYNEMMKEYLGGHHATCEDDHINIDAPTSVGKKRKCDLNNQSERESYIASFLAEKYYIPRTENDNHQFLPELWSMEPRIFALETSSTGKRKYIVGNLGRFMQHYWRDSDPRSRHFYELIPEGAPCRLYFDLEFSKVANPHITSRESEVLITEFINELVCEVQLIYGIKVDRKCIVDLDSSTNVKFSRHLIVHLPNGELFADASSAGLFVKRFVGRLAEELSTGILKGRHATLAKYLFVNKKAPKPTNESLSMKDTTKEQHHIASNGFDNRNMTCFVDLGVYTRNRLFRLMGSFKYGKCASSSLRIATENQYCFPDGFDNSKFYVTNQRPVSDINATAHCSDSKDSRDLSHESFCAALDWESHARALAMSLVVPANASKMNVPILMDPNESGGAQAPVKSSAIARRRNISSSRRFKTDDSPIPELDRFILQISARGGVQGKIRSVSMESTHFMSYQMADNRWCECINRSHKSNNIIWNVDLKYKTYWQTCHDPECRALDFRGNKRQLPDEVAASIDDYLLDQELANINEERVIQEATNKNAFGDSEFDEALGDIDMSLFTPRSCK